MADLSGALDLIKMWESFKAKAYLCPAGVQTIGYGATGHDIRLGMVWTEQEATKDLENRVDKLFHQVSDLLDYDYDDNEFCAILSLVYNIGIGAFRSSTFLKKLNESIENDAPKQFLVWKKAMGRTLKGLQGRRICEYIYYTKGVITPHQKCLELIPVYYP